MNEQASRENVTKQTRGDDVLREVKMNIRRGWLVYSILLTVYYFGMGIRNFIELKNLGFILEYSIEILLGIVSITCLYLYSLNHKFLVQTFWRLFSIVYILIQLFLFSEFLLENLPMSFWYFPTIIWSVLAFPQWYVPDVN